MQVRAISPGFHGHYRNTGDVFDVPNGAKATWFVPVKQTGGQAPQANTQAGGTSAASSGQSLV